MDVDPPEPARRPSAIVLTVLVGVLSLLALVLPIAPIQLGSGSTVQLPVVALPFSPIERRADAVALVIVLLLCVALVLPTVALLRALVRRRSGRVVRPLTVVSGIVVVLFGFFFAASALAPVRWVSIPAVVAMLSAGILVLVAQSTVLAGFDTGAGRDPQPPDGS